MKQKKTKEVYLREESSLCKRSSLCKEADSSNNDAPVSVEKQEESIMVMDQDEHNITGRRTGNIKTVYL